MHRIPIPLLLLIIVIAFPVAIPIAIVLHMRDLRRMRAVAERTRCECCGAPLGVASLRRAETEWAKRAAARRANYEASSDPPRLGDMRRVRRRIRL
jgi:hypothetical protein